MGLESATYIDDLVITNPAGADDRSTADDHLRLIKSVLKTSFPSINGAVSASLAEINKLDGLQSTQSELNMLSGRSLASNDDVIDNFEAGIRALFQQSAAPTGWTKQTTHNNKAMRVVSGTASSGGSTNFTNIFQNPRQTDSHALTVAELPAHDHGSAGDHGHAAAGTHTHTVTAATGADLGGGVPSIDDTSWDASWYTPNTTQISLNSTAPNHTHANAGAHTHTSVGSSDGHQHNFNMDVQYVDVIIASKD